MGSPALESWIKSTVLIENEWGELGTGFLVMRYIEEPEAQAYLVTNKHVLNSDPNLRAQSNEIYINVNMRDQNNNVFGQRGILPLHYTGSERRWREHPDPDVDVIAFDVTRLIVDFPQLEKTMSDYTAFANRETLSEHDITIGDDILSIGYPIGLKQGNTNYPIVRSGIIATKIGESFQDEIEENGQKRIRNIRGFLIDGAIVPGSSGSPVLLKPVVGRYVKDSIHLDIAPALLLGIVSETFYAPVRTPAWDIPSFAGLGLALDADTIRETIELFYQ